MKNVMFALAFAAVIGFGAAPTAFAARDNGSGHGQRTPVAFFKEAGFTVDTSPAGVEAAAKIFNERPDVKEFVMSLWRAKVFGS